jgi:hypothetical protein
MAKSLSTDWVRYNPTLKDIDNKISAYMRSFPSRPKDITYQQALRKTAQDFKLPFPVDVRHCNDVIRHFPHPERSPGLPYTKQGIIKKSEVPVSTIRWNIHKMKYKQIKFRTPCTAAAKTTVQPPGGEKFRLVWVYPVDMTIAEGMFAQPLIRSYNSRRWSPYSIWFRYHLGDAHRLSGMNNSGTEWLGLDYSAFDVNVPAWLIRDAFSILRENLNFSRYEYYGAPTHPETLPNLWSAIIQYFINTPIKTKAGKIVVTKTGIPSGSYFTNLIDSVCNAIMLHYALLHENIKYYEHFVMGDDSLVRVKKGDVNLYTFAEFIKQSFGAVINPEKSELGPYVQWLGYRLGPQYPTCNIQKAIAQILLPSKPDRYDYDVFTRTKAVYISTFCDPILRKVLEKYHLITDTNRKFRSEVIERLEYLNLDITDLTQRLLV